jgi:hypothetical protein
LSIATWFASPLDDFAMSGSRGGTASKLIALADLSAALFLDPGPVRQRALSEPIDEGWRKN